MTIQDSQITPLHNIIKNIILSSPNKSITMHEYINLCLYHPEYGYYKSRDVVGQNADFITSPEISQMFGECIAAYIIDYLISNNIKNFILVELGPGNGTLMSDLLRIFERYDLIPHNIYMVEVSNYLRDIQKEKLKKYKINWVDDIGKINLHLPVICISNEFFDAFSPKIFISDDEECMVTIDSEDKFCYIEEHVIPIFRLNETYDFKSEDAQRIEKYVSTSESCKNRLYHLKMKFGISESKFEINELGEEYADRLDNMLPKKSLVIAIDYGYTGNFRVFSLQSISKHQKTDYFSNPGENDITFLVDFTRLANCFSNALEKNIITQREFLISCGIIERSNFLINNSLNKKEYIKNSLNRLISEDEMGENFKVLICKY